MSMLFVGRAAREAPSSSVDFVKLQNRLLAIPELDTEEALRRRLRNSAEALTEAVARDWLDTHS
jgi:Fe-S-cluster formation regulator IscX/YfhJ